MNGTETIPKRWPLALRGTHAVPRMRPAVLFGILAAALVTTVLLGVGMGAVEVGSRQVAAIVLQHLGWNTGVAYTEQQDAVVWAIRMPRVILAALTGSALAVAGAALQGMFRNPLADPGLIGVSSGAALAAVTSIVLNISWFGGATLPLFAFTGGMITAVIGYGLARNNGRTEIVTLVLAGIALNTFAGAGTAILAFAASDSELRTVVFWSLGSLGGATWQSVGTTVPFIATGLAAALRWGRSLNLLVLGEREARHLGLNTERVRLAVIAVTALLTGATVAVAGVIGFVGLIVPHLVRLVAGPDHRVVLPASALGGAVLVVLADLIARRLVVPAELPLGVVTALIGGPFLLLLMTRHRRAEGGWG